jgi:phosphonopyruvate decarboxylase
MIRNEALDIIMERIPPDAAVVSTTGLISRYLFEQFDSKRHFYSPGAMGLVSSIALGLAISVPSRTVVAVDGDGSLLMNLGSIVTIGAAKPRNLIHVVLNNAAYASCSHEPTLSPTADLAEMVRITGYRTVKNVACASELIEGLNLNPSAGPVFILVTIELGGPRNHTRPLDLPALTTRFKYFMASHRQNTIQNTNKTGREGKIFRVIKTSRSHEDRKRKL